MCRCRRVWDLVVERFDAVKYVLAYSHHASVMWANVFLISLNSVLKSKFAPSICAGFASFAFQGYCHLVLFPRRSATSLIASLRFTLCITVCRLNSSVNRILLFILVSPWLQNYQAKCVKILDNLIISWFYNDIEEIITYYNKYKIVFKILSL